MARRRLGTAATRTLAASPGIEAAVAELLTSPYAHDMAPGATVAQAQHAVASTLLWHLRVLAGWLPRNAADVLRVLAGWFEVANVDERLRLLSGQTAEPAYRLGSLATVVNRLAGTASPGEIRQVLATSPWGDPGGDEPRTIMLGMRLGWAERVCARVPQARPWAKGAAALTLARERFVAGRALPAGAAASGIRLLGAGALAAPSLDDLRATLDREARWALTGVQSESSLWTAEARLWRRVESDATAMLRQPRPGPEPVVATAALLAADAWRVRAALECAARGGAALEAFDAVA